MIKTGAFGWWWRTSRAFPGIEANMMVVAAGGNKCGSASVSLRQLEAENAAVKLECALQIGDFQVNVADANGGINRSGRVFHFVYDFMDDGN